ncbi:MAG: FAD-dependent oxidoreductase [Proteobacteria bacterium]|nr:FAD-dependent oxidoreductase [Pseudomonadota bacterium]
MKRLRSEDRMVVKLNIDGRELEAREGETILAVAERAGIEIPTLCHQPELKPFASCFICAVEIEGRPRLVPSCATLAEDGMVVSTSSARVRESRKVCVELIMSDHVGDCRGPCQVECPAGIDIPGFISLLAHNGAEEAIRLIKEALPFPASLGRVCPRPCETQCRRACEDEPVSICFLKRYVADEDLLGPSPYVPPVGAATGKRVAIVGAGPAGLSAAFYLRRLGHDAVVFDSHEEPGGMLRYGIPAYRLPRDILAKEIDVIKKMGVEIRCGARLGRDFTVDSLMGEFDALFLAIGAQSSSNMGAEGEGAALPGIDFLQRVAEGEKIDLGDDVIVVGGGNTAIDAARTSLRLGAKRVTILYRRTRDEMPADRFEIEAAEREGVAIRFLAAPVRMAHSGGGVELTCVEMKLGEPDGSGRRRPVPLPGSEFTLNASTVIAAIGQGVDADCVEDAKDVRLTKWRTLDINPDTFETSRMGVFAGGDCATGADIAVTAIAAGRKAATSIDQHLRGEPVTGEPRGYLHLMAARPEDAPEEVKELVRERPADREKMPELPARMRVKGFDEVETGFTAEQARREAERCLSCGCRSFESCTLRRLAEEYGAKPERFAGAKRAFFVDESHEKIRYESHKCIMCGSCVRVCSEVKGLDALGFVGRGFPATMKPALERPWELSSCDSCLKCVPMCPTGAISLKVTPADEVRARFALGTDASKDITGETKETA